jgi:hypothetical protein
MTTPIRASFVAGSDLLLLVCEGVQALKKGHKNKLLHDDIRASFSDSIDIDQAFLEGHEQENRWDYLLGHKASSTVIALEPHSAKTDQISTVIAKRKAAMEQLRIHLKPGAVVVDWFWVASGTVDFADTEKARLRLDQNGTRSKRYQVRRRQAPEEAPPFGEQPAW